MGCPGGFVGVDVFFVISGYLISSLVLEEIETGRFSIVNFWERRIRRLLPALAVVTSATLAAAWFVMMPEDFARLGRSVVAQVLLVANVNFWMESGYFAPVAETKPLLNTWSLAVEEQFYVLLPWALLGLVRFGRRHVGAILFGAGLLSFGLGVWATYRFPGASYFLLPTRAWELLAGAVLAVCRPTTPMPRLVAEAMSWGGLLAIGIAVTCFGAETPFPGVAALLPCGGTVALLWANRDAPTSLARILEFRPLVFIGLISYSLYLWHWPMLTFANYWGLSEAPGSRQAILLLASLVVSAVTWRWVEQPFRKRSILHERRHLFVAAGCASAALAAAGMAVVFAHGVPQRIPQAARDYFAGRDDAMPTANTTLQDAREGAFQPLGVRDATAALDLLVWGDSHAGAILPAIDLLARKNGVRAAAATHPSTLPLLGYESSGGFSLRGESRAFNQAVLDFVRAKRVRAVLLAAAWHGYDDEDGRMRMGLQTTIAALREAGAAIWIMKQVPQHNVDVPKALAAAVLFDRPLEEHALTLAQHRSASRVQDEMFSAIAVPGVRFLESLPFFMAEADRCRIAADGRSLYRDAHHLSTKGAIRLVPLFEELFAARDRGAALDSPQRR